MKKILDKALTESNIQFPTRDLIKLRLRGKGSGFKEGIEKIESEEPLHLCVSAKNLKVFNVACKYVDKLLTQIYLEYIKHLKVNNLVSNNQNNPKYFEQFKFKKFDGSN